MNNENKCKQTTIKLSSSWKSRFGNSFRSDRSMTKVSSVFPVDVDQGERCCGKNVQFGNVKIREYPIIIGDNVPTSNGPPISIDWTHVSSMTVPLEDFESERDTYRRPSEAVQKLPPSRRRSILKNLGYSRSEIDQGTKAANIRRNKRRKTRSTLRSYKMQERLEILRSRMHNVLTLGQKDRAEQQFLETHVPSSSPRIIE